MYKIVIIENENIVRKGLILTIKWEDMNAMVVGEASHGIEGKKVILDVKPDIVITDIRMPGMDGLQMIQELKQKNVKTEFIIVSGYSEFEYAQRAIRLGVMDFLLKPIDEDELEKCMIRVQNRISKSKDQEKLISKISEMNESPYMLFEKYFQNYNFALQEDNVTKLTHYIEENIHRELSISELSEYLQVSDGHLSRSFKKNTGYTVLEYITLVRMKKSIELLQDSNVRIAEVAYKLGFNDPKYFSHQFRKYIGVTPTEFRNRLN